MQLLVLEATHDPELDPCKVPLMVTARLSSFINHPRLFSEICETMTGQIESRLTTAAEAYQKGREADERASSAQAMTWVSHSLSTIKEWPIEKRLPLLVFLDYLTSLPTKVSDADSGQLSMKELFSADGRAKYWPQTATLPTMLQFARASTTHGQHLRIVHALLDDIEVGSQILDTFVQFPTKQLGLGGSVTPQLIESVLAKHGDK